jgi:ribosomal protein L12E/L44/L45/RPP1/RPP2
VTQISHQQEVKPQESEAVSVFLRQYSFEVAQHIVVGRDLRECIVVENSQRETVLSVSTGQKKEKKEKEKEKEKKRKKRKEKKKEKKEKRKKKSNKQTNKAKESYRQSTSQYIVCTIRHFFCLRCALLQRRFHSLMCPHYWH